MSTAQQLPFLPGYRIETKPRTNFKKQHLFDVRNGIRVDANRELAVIDQRSFPVEGGQTGAISGNSMSMQGVGEQGGYGNDAQYNGSASLSATGAQPAWVAYDRKVLRFYCYFKEAVFSSPVENYRVRKCVLYYYLEDDSVHIAEPKIENSGIPQGVFIKRHRIPKASNEYVNMNDLFIGSELDLYGRVFRLVDCDDFTRAFFDENSSPLGPAEKLPLDPFTKKHTVELGTHKKLMHPMKEFMEASLGKQMGVEIPATQKFLKNDGKVLRFYCLWKDTKMYGEARPYVLHYFLADDTVEVMEVKQPNSGRDPFPALLKRQKLPKDFFETSPDVSRIGANTDEKVQFYNEADLRVGDHITVYGRPLLLCGVDLFTKQFYVDNYGMPEEAFPMLNMEDQSDNPAQMAPPPYNGFGSEEDSLGSFLYLMPKVPKVDFKKQMENDGLNLRFLAKFVDPAPEDKNRTFIVTYFMNNDQLSVFEKFERNSGFIGGKFLERTRITNPKTGDAYFAQDLMVGVDLEINSYKFVLLQADTFTQNYIESHPEVWTQQAPQAQGEQQQQQPDSAFAPDDIEERSF